MICSVDDCDRKAVARGWCNKHWQRWRLHGDPTHLVRLARRQALDPEDGVRVCRECRQKQPLSQYDKDSRGPQGRRTQCKSCRSALMKAWYAANQERQCQRQRDRVADHPDRIRQQDTERYRRHRASRIELAVDHGNRRRARLLNLPWEPGLTVLALRKRDGSDCHYCGVTMDFRRADGRVFWPTKATLEHVIPISRGGGHVSDNVVLACWQCNLRKNRKLVDEWEREAS